MSGRLKPAIGNAVVGMVFGLAFLAVTLVAARIAFSAITDTVHRHEKAVRVQGTVLGLVTRCEAKSAKWKTSCWPHLSVRYTDADGHVRQFVGTGGSTDPKEVPGDFVTVTYVPGDTRHAEVEAPVMEWVPSAAFSLLASVFGTASLVLLAKNIVLWRDRRWLVAHGMRVEAGDISLIRIPGLHATSYKQFVVIAQWRDPRDAARVEFRSDPLDYDPTVAVRSRPTIGVWIDPDRPSRYWMEISTCAQPGRRFSIGGL